MKFYMHQRIIGENLIKIGLILSAQWRFSEERYQACPVTLIKKYKTFSSTRVEIGKTKNCVETRRPQGGVFSHNFEFFQFSRVLI